MARTPTAVFNTVGHMAHTAMVNSAPSSLACLPAPRNSTRPSGSQASGDTGRSTWMIGSKVLVNVFESPRQKPMGVPINSARKYPLATSVSEYQVKRRIPWSISPRFSKGLRMYSLLAVQVFSGEGSSLAQVALERLQTPITIATPTNGRRSQSNLNFESFILLNRFLFLDDRLRRRNQGDGKGDQRRDDGLGDQRAVPLPPQPMVALIDERLKNPDAQSQRQRAAPDTPLAQGEQPMTGFVGAGHGVLWTASAGGTAAIETA